MKNNRFKTEDYADALCEEAHELRVNNNPKLAVKQYLTSILIKRNNLEAYKGLSLTYKKLKDYERAIGCLLKAKEMAQFDSAIYYELGLNYLLNAQPPEASKHLRRAIRLDNKNYNAQIQLALSHELMDEPQIALSIYQKIIEEKPSFMPAYNHKAGLYMANDDYNNAISVFKQMLDVNKHYYKAYLGLGICFDKSGYPSKALTNYKKFISLAPNSRSAKHIKIRIKFLNESIKEKISYLKLVK